jgi:hypothetical protein
MNVPEYLLFASRAIFNALLAQFLGLASEYNRRVPAVILRRNLMETVVALLSILASLLTIVASVVTILWALRKDRSD